MRIDSWMCVYLNIIYIFTVKAGYDSKTDIVRFPSNLDLQHRPWPLISEKIFNRAEHRGILWSVLVLKFCLVVDVWVWSEDADTISIHIDTFLSEITYQFGNGSCPISTTKKELRECHCIWQALYGSIMHSPIPRHQSSIQASKCTLHPETGKIKSENILYHEHCSVLYYSVVQR